MGFSKSQMPKILSNHESKTSDLTRFLAFVIWKTPYSNFLLTVFSQSSTVMLHQNDFLRNMSQKDKVSGFPIILNSSFEIHSYLTK